MSLQPISRVVAGSLALAFASVAPAQPASTAPAVTVTIGDYSAAQRAAIDADIRKALAAAQSGAAATAVDAKVPAPTTALPIPVLPSPAASGPAGSRSLPFSRPAEPRLAVSGVALVRGGWVAEVATDDGSTLLRAGEVVPGTPWRVTSVAPHQVVLARAADKAKTVTKTFTLTEVR